jgi:hypothetical protein
MTKELPKGSEGGMGGFSSNTPKAVGSKGKLGVSVRSTEVDSGTRRMVTKQNKAADSYKIKDLDKMEKNKASYQKQKESTQQKVNNKVGQALVDGATIAGGSVAIKNNMNPVSRNGATKRHPDNKSAKGN